MNSLEILAVIPLTLVIVGGILIGLSLRHRARIRELMYRERIAMIERGMLPPAIASSSGAIDGDPARRTRQGRHRSAGVILMGLGLGVGILIAFTADAEIGAGVGGALAALGLAFFINSILDRRDVGLAAAERPSASSEPDAASRPEA